LDIVVPKKEELASKECDFAEGLWLGQQKFQVPVTNWGNQPLVLEQGSVIGYIEEVDLIDKDDTIWKDTGKPTVRKVNAEDAKLRQEELSAQLNFGDSCNQEEQEGLKRLLCSKHQVFALADHELGEVDLVEHKIMMGEHQPFQTSPL